MISILLAHYDETGEYRKYLELCFKSLEAQTFQDFEIILVTTGKEGCNIESFVESKRLTIVRDEKRKHFPEAIEEAYKWTSEASKYIMLLNNDTILHKDCLETMHQVLEHVPIPIILNPLCNSDAKGMFYLARTGIPSIPSFNFSHTYEEIEPFFDEIINDAFRYEPVIVKMAFSPFYCTMMSREIYEKVGKIDSRYKTSKDDLDFAVRAKKLDIQTMAALHAFCFHFAGATSSKNLSQEDKEFNAALFKEKHGFEVSL